MRACQWLAALVSWWPLRTPLPTRLQDAIIGLPFVVIVVAWLIAYAGTGLIFYTIYVAHLGDLLVSNRLPATWQDALSFSFVTQATIGYGDVVPASYMRLVANMQAVVGTGLNGAALGLITFRILRRGVPIRAADSISFHEIGEDRFSFWIRYLSVDTRDLVDVTVSVFFITDGAGLNPRYDTFGGQVREMTLATVTPMIIMALDVPAANGRLNFRSPDDAAAHNDRQMPIGPGAFFDGDEIDRHARLVLRIRGLHSSTGELVSFVREYHPTQIRCQPFDEINNGALRFVTLGKRRKAAAAKLNRFSGEERASCAACAALPSCPFTAGPVGLESGVTAATI